MTAQCQPELQSETSFPRVTKTKKKKSLANQLYIG